MSDKFVRPANGLMILFMNYLLLLFPQRTSLKQHNLDNRMVASEKFYLICNNLLQPMINLSTRQDVLVI